MRRAILYYIGIGAAHSIAGTLKNYFSRTRVQCSSFPVHVLIAHLHTGSDGDAEITRAMEQRNVKVMLMGAI